MEETKQEFKDTSTVSSMGSQSRYRADLRTRLTGGAAGLGAGEEEGGSAPGRHRDSFEYRQPSQAEGFRY